MQIERFSKTPISVKFKPSEEKRLREFCAYASIEVGAFIREVAMGVVNRPPGSPLVLNLPAEVRDKIFDSDLFSAQNLSDTLKDDEKKTILSGREYRRKQAEKAVLAASGAKGGKRGRRTL